MALFQRIRNLFTRSRVEREIELEFRAHLEMRIEDNIAAGMSPEQARRDALLRFGNRTSTKEHVVSMDAALFLESITSDLRYACRQLYKNVGFSVTAITVLALGICASISIFAFVDALLIRPLPYRQPSQLVVLFESTPSGPRFHLSYLDYLDWKRRNHVFSEMDAYHANPVALKTPEGVQRADAASVGAGFFQLLGVVPALGRDFRPGEDTLEASRTAILSYSSWQKRFGQRPDILGQTVTLDGVSTEIVGVLPRDFSFAPAPSAEFWMPIHASLKPEDRGEHGLLAVARLKEGVSLETASAEIGAIAQQLAMQYPDTDGGRGATAVSLTEMIIGKIRPTLWLLLSAVILLLIIACINVCGLLLVRFQVRQQEIAVRSALGASAGRLILQFTAESVVLSLAAALVGIGASFATLHLLRQLVPLNLLQAMPYLRELGFGSHVWMFGVGICLVCMVLFTGIGVLRIPMAGLRQGLTDGGRTSASTVWQRLGANLIIIELSTATILLVGAGLLCKSFYKLLHTEIGLQPDHVATLRLEAPTSKYSKDAQLIELSNRVKAEVSRLPGVVSVAVAHQVPIADMAGGNTAFSVIGDPDKKQIKEANSRQVSEEFFPTLRARLWRGRWFSETDDASRPHVAIINQSLAKKYFGGTNPLGRQLQFDESQSPVEIIGIVEDLKEGSLDSETPPAIYTPFRQSPDPVFFVVARSQQEPNTLLTALSTTIHGIDPDLLVLRSETMEDRIRDLESTYLHRTAATLLSGFAAVALLLSAIGLYGVIAYSVTQRTREIGIRIALGATRDSVYRLILGEGGRLVVIGILAGGVGAVGAGMLMSKLLFRTAPWDGLTLAGVMLVLTLTAVAACILPARRAAKIEPGVALRSE